jgi:hypothetical protein
MELTATSKIKNLQQAGMGYMIAGLGMLAMGVPYWFLGKDLEEVFANHWVGIFQINDNFKEAFVGSWGFVLASIGLLIGAGSLLKIGEPVGWKKRKLFLIPILGSICHLLSVKILVPFAPLGSFLYAVGFILIGVASLKIKIWDRWKRWTPLFIGLFPFGMMYPLLVITGNPPHHIIPLWGITFGFFGLSAWLRSKEIENKGAQ